MAASGSTAANEESRSDTLLYEEPLRGVRGAVKDESGKVTSYVKMGCHGEMKITTGGSFILQETSCCVCCNSKINIPCSAVVEMQTGSSFSDSGIYFSPGSCGTCSGEVLTIRGSYRGISFAMGVVTQAPDELQQKIAKAKMWCDAQPDSVADGSSAQGFGVETRSRNTGGASAAAASQGK